jgi:putative DNA primase/helicase
MNIVPESSLVCQALDYASHGLKVFPLHTPTPDGGCSCHNPDCSSQGKHPRTPNGVKDATTDEHQIRAWWEKWPNANIGIATGLMPDQWNLLVVDIDPKHGASLEALEAHYGAMPKTAKVRTGSGGYHLFFKTAVPALGNSANKLAQGVDTRCNGGYVVAAPSLHKSGQRYEWMVSLDTVAEIPASIQKALMDRRPSRENTQGDEMIEEGGRNSYLFTQGCSLRARGLTDETIEAALLTENERRCTPPLSESEVHRIIQSVLRYESGTFPTPPSVQAPRCLTELGNAQALVARCGDRMRYVPQWGWMIYDGNRWRRDEQGLQVMRWAKETVRSFYQEAATTENEQERRDLIDHARRSEAHYHLRAMVELAQSEPEVIARVEDFDRDLYLFNVQNGTLDLRTGELRPHKATDLLTRISPVAYNPQAKSEVWEKFIEEITNGDTGVKNYLQRAVGYSLTGDTREECLFVLHGSGRNGKSKFLEAIQYVTGDYAHTAAAQTFLRRENTAPSNDIAALAGARFVMTSEIAQGRTLDTALIKQLTGGDAITARLLYREGFTFKPQFKLFMATNSLPQVDENTPAIWARIKLVPFTVSFEGREDRELSNKLRTAAEAILAWAVEGCLLWQQSGLQEPESVKIATSEYRAEEDVIGDFILERCDVGEGLAIKARELYQSYKAWCDSEGLHPMSQTAFGTRIKTTPGVHGEHTRNGNMYVGITTRRNDTIRVLFPASPNDTHAGLEF